MKKLKTLLHRIENFILSMLLLLMLLPIVVTGQTITLTQSSPAYNVGSHRYDSAATIKFEFTADDYLHFTQSGFRIFSHGDNFAYVTYPTLTWVTNYWGNNNAGTYGYWEVKDNFSLVGVCGYEVLADKKPHTLTFRRTQSKKEFLLDSVLMGSVTTKANPQFTANILLSTHLAYMKLSGTVKNFTYSPSFITGSIACRNGIVDTVNYPIGYMPFSNNWTNVPTPKQQYESALLPIWHNGHKTERNSLCVEMKYLAGWNPNVSNNWSEITANGQWLMDRLVRYYNVAPRICSNINSFYSDYSRGNYSFDMKMMEVAKDFPYVRKDIGSAMVQTSDIPPLIANELDESNINTPLSYFKGTRDIVVVQTTALKAAMAFYGISDTGCLWWEDFEGMPAYGGGVNGTNKHIENFRYMLDSGQSMFPRLQSTGYNAYSYWWDSGSLLFPKVLEIGNLRRSTMSQYIERPEYWNTLTGGTIHGAGFTMKAYWDEISNGFNRQTPFVSPGWSMNIENDFPHTQWVGMLGIDLVLGADFFFPAYFTLGGNVQNPKSYCDIPAMPAYVQASVSNPKYQNILKNGVLVQGTSAGVGDNNYWDYNIWAKDKEILTVAKRFGNEYIIATTHQKNHIYKYRTKRKVDCPIVLDGEELMLFSRPTATIWYYDKSKPKSSTNPKMISSQCKNGHWTRWDSTSADND